MLLWRDIMEGTKLHKIIKVRVKLKHSHFCRYEQKMSVHVLCFYLMCDTEPPA